MSQAVAQAEAAPVGEAALLTLAGGTGLAEQRAQALDRFRQHGLPTVRNEAWKYTNLNPLRSEAWQAPDERTNIHAVRDTELNADVKLVLVNGRLRPELCRLPKLAGLHIDSLADLMPRAPGDVAALLTTDASLPMLDLNTAGMTDGYVIRLDDGAHVEPLIEVVSLAEADTAPLAYQPRHLILVGKDSSATIVERHVGAGHRYFVNGASQLVLRPGATLRHYRFLEEGADAVHTHTALARLEENASLESFNLVLGGRLTRTEVHVALAGRGARVALNGAYGLVGQEHCDNTTVVEHIAAETASRQVFKGVLGGRSRAVFQGRISVKPDAQKIDGHQLCKTMLLSDGAEIDTKPELEILADDVKCSHGATAGEIDAEQLFYMRARGVPEAEARAMLIHAFLTDVVEEVSHDAVRAALAARIAAWLAGEAVQ
jgi:Fe-S cluster assembly protein SufD